MRTQKELLTMFSRLLRGLKTGFKGEAGAKALPWSQRLLMRLKIIDFSLPIGAWSSTREVLGSILLASLIVNVLSLAFPMTLLQIYDRIIPNVAYNTLVLLVIGVGVAILLETILRSLRSYVGAWADSKFEHLIGCEAFHHIIGCSLQEFISEGTGAHIKRINSINQMRDFYAGQALVSMADMPFVILLFAFIAYIAGYLVLVPITLLTIFLSLTVAHASKLGDVLRNRQRHDERRSSFIIESLSNIHTIKSVTMESQMMRRYERLQRTSAVSDFEISQLGSESMLNSTLMSQLTIVLVVTFGSIMVIKGQLTIGGMAACTLLSGRVLQPVSSLVSVWTRLQTIKIARDELQSILDLPLESKEGAKPLEVTDGAIEFKDIMFRYKEDTPYVLKGFNLNIPAKAAISIGGAGLSGKSTVCWLLLAMLKPQTGSVTIDGQDIHQCQAQSVRKNIAYLPQEGVLFNGTIIENLTMFEQGREVRSRAIAAAKFVGLSEVIERLPQGYETPVADQSIDALPRGIRQRIAIARAFVHEPLIVIFDEANAAIDVQGDNTLKKVLQKLVGKVTLIIISHRPSVSKIATTHYTLEDGVLRTNNEHLQTQTN